MSDRSTTVAPLRIAFFGLPLAAVLLARDGHAIVYAGLCRSAPGRRRVALRIAPGRTWVRPDAGAQSTLARVRDAAPDLLVSWFWTTRLPPALLALAPSVGVHPSLLPRHRGPDPYFWAIDRGDAVTGVTAHELGEEYDTGPILGSCRLPIDPAWDAWRLARALDRPSLVLLREVVRQIAAGTPPAAVAQDERAATPAPEPNDEELAIRWSWAAERIERRVRAAAPWPGTWTEIAGSIVTLVRVKTTRDYPAALVAGEAAVRSDGVAVVRASEGAVELLAGRDEDDRALSAADFASLVAAARMHRRREEDSR
jgi:methionyl-tRNA formyltransferase